MWKQLWKTWTIDKPAALGDWLWQAFVVELAASLSRLTVRQIIAFIPVVILIIAYAHSIPIPPELMLVGDLLAYIDVFSMILLLSLMTRAATFLYVVRQTLERMLAFVRYARASLRPDSRHRRVSGLRSKRRFGIRSKSDDDGPAPAFGLAWA
ncbi:MAG: hypothetical protein JSS22_19320 [Proteobacteria bacterium]|nr:hypothetical protein [Pseudomonadota bacterium]